MIQNNINVQINVAENYAECNFEADLISYMLKIKLLESGIPVIIDPLSIRSDVISVKHGKLKQEIIRTGIVADSYYNFTWKQND
ncbi:hypothetical protein phiAS5_ORF0158 [Aeromonas phage phiAS5]|uniref:Uncharacterized protein n=1 Tax=Aeromonas phage phiAS5 TaxID=879630 RepID=E1A2Q5_9CAUD|nr:hypothetical protein phiAS5_ORF0158 [Aeromonas phage phiAS5]ADM80001.1 hypothetical protein phiAS5_ORF0158 [Aeromonas phage phiAS5]BES53228.1 hypothetical protein [Aeromonas phage phiWae14]